MISSGRVGKQYLLDAHLLSLGSRGLELLALAEVGGEGDDLAAVGLLQPLQDHRGVQPARVGEHDFLDIAHGMVLPFASKAHAGRRGV